MMKTILLIVVVFASVNAIEDAKNVNLIRQTLDALMTTDMSTEQLYQVWKDLYSKHTTLLQLTVSNTSNKLKNFEEKVAAIKAHNLSNSSYKKGLNHFSDMSREEFRQYYKLDRTFTPSEVKKTMLRENNFQLKSSVLAGTRTTVDHTKYMMEVRDQRQCGACWAFATMAVIEGNWQMTGRALEDHLSAQQLLDCDKDDSACDGGWYEGSLGYLKSNYAILNKNYPYYNYSTGFCNYQYVPKTAIRIDGYNWVESDDNGVYELLKRGPIGIAVAVDDNWMDYESGIYDGPCENEINHAVTCVGYGITDDATEYWLVRNSWGLNWGEGGHIKIQTNKANNNSCHVGNFAFQPTGFN
jgi:C1A family cysteine protease